MVAGQDNGLGIDGNGACLLFLLSVADAYDVTAVVVVVAA
jgi:hypothetical protein